MSKIKGQFIDDNSVDGSKIRLSNGQALKGRNAANSADVPIVSVDSNNRVRIETDIDLNSKKLLNVPAPSASADLIRKSDLDTALSTFTATTGVTWRTGTTDPSNSLGNNNDFYINTSTGNLFQKANGAYTVALNLKGPAGNVGATGQAGPAGQAGVSGKTILSGNTPPTTGQGSDGDFYLNKSDYTFYGPKVSGAWGSPTSLIGPAGSGTGGGTTVATGISVTPTGNLESTTAQGALVELQGDIDTLTTEIAAKYDTATANAALALKADLASMTSALAAKYNVSDATAALALKANTTDVNTALASKYNTTDATAALALKANQTDLTNGLALKANITDMNTALALKADAAAVTSALSAKYDTATAVAALALKADVSAMNTALSAKYDTATATAALALKADITAMNAALALKYNTSDATAALALKADAAAMTTALAAKYDTATATAALALKADLSAMNTALADKIGTTAFNTALALKADLSSMTTALADKVSNATFDSAIALKADLSAMNTTLASKADATATANALALKADLSALSAGLASKITSPITTGQEGKFLAFTENGYGFLTPGLTLNRVETGASDYTYDTATPAPNIIEVSNLAISRTVTLPGATEVPDGWSLDVTDATGECGTKRINVQPKDPSTEDVAGGSALQLTSANASLSMYLNRPKKSWKIRSSFGSYQFVPVAFIPTVNGATSLKARLDGSPASSDNFDFIGSQVSVWKDLSGNNNHFVAPYSSAGWDYNLSPGYDGGSFSGQGGLRFIAGGNQFLESNKPMSFIDMNSYTAIVVLRRPTNYDNIILNDKTHGKYIVGSNGYNRMGVKDNLYSPYGLPKNRDVVYAVCNNGGDMTYYMDGIKCAGNLMGTPYSGPMGILQMGGAFGPGNPGVANNMWISGFLLYDGPLTDAQHQSIYAFYANRYSLTSVASSLNVLCEGDSIMQGAAGFLNHMVDDAMISLGYTSFDYVNWAVSGSKVPDMQARALNNVDSHFDYTKPSNRNLLLISIGTNDLAYNSSATGQTLFDSVKSYCQSRKALKGWKIGLATVLPRTEPTAISNGHEAKRIAYNQLLRDNAVAQGWADIIVDIGNDPNMGPNAAAADNTTYYYDRIHPNDVGHATLAGIWAPAINTLLNS